ncbi:MAG: acetyl-CoA hydrolase/transferase family protein [Thermomicrobiales bacterium]|nr:acetyl-CoA hydrolase/transferase family protein [Thermomicrobiales bacterium]
MKKEAPAYVSADEAVSVVQSGHRVYLHEVAMTPHRLVNALCRRAMSLERVETVSLHTEGPAPYVAPEMAGHIRHNALFAGANVRAAINDGRADYTPVFLSQIPELMRERRLPVDVALLQVSPPDHHGFCRLGMSIACARAAAEAAQFVIGQVNPRVPRSMGNSAIHVSQFHALVEADEPLPEAHPVPFGDVENQIGEHIAALVPDRATIQMGIGAIPDAVLARLTDREDLGVHTEMFTDGLVDLAEAGVITNKYKSTWRGRIVTSFALGSKRLYEFVDGNPFVEFHTSDIVNDTREIRRIDGMVAINSALQVDLTGQVVADSIGERFYSGIGGQMDFIHGANLAHNGKAIIALPSTAKHGEVSRIAPCLDPGSGVVTTRGHVQYVATEYGVVNLEGQPIRKRTELLISIAHPDFRADLRAYAVKRKLIAL